MQSTKETPSAGRIALRDISLIAMFAAVIAVCSWISIPLAVPLTMQTFAVFLAGLMLGPRRAVAAVGVYILLGAAGLPVFAGFNAGAGVLLGSTGGYIIGFVFTALLSGAAGSRFSGSGWKMMLLMLLGLLICYAFGTAWFIVVYARQSGPVGVTTALAWCVFPYIVPDILKMLLAVTVMRRFRLYKA